MRYNDMRGNNDNFLKEVQEQQRIGFKINTDESTESENENIEINEMNVIEESSEKINTGSKQQYHPPRETGATNTLFSLSILIRVFIEAAVAGAAFYLFGPIGLVIYGVVLAIRVLIMFY